MAAVDVLALPLVGVVTGTVMAGTTSPQQFDHCCRSLLNSCLMLHQEFSRYINYRFYTGA
jgi:hypothetical protein